MCSGLAMRPSSLGDQRIALCNLVKEISLMRGQARWLKLLLLVIAPLALHLSGCASVSQSNASTPTSLTNQTPLIAHTPNSGFNRFTVTVDVCIPGTQSCISVPNVLVDTGSTGLRIQASALALTSGATLALPALTAADGSVLSECYRFGGGAAWGALSTADVSIGGTRAPAMSIQVVTSNQPNQPSACPSGGTTSNGTLGIGINDYDCGLTCTMPEYLKGQTGPKYQYYGCSDTACNAITGAIATSLQLENPTAVLDGGIYNGAVLDLPAVADGGATQAVGTLTFGVNTLANNMLVSPTIVSVSGGGVGYFTTTYNGVSYTSSFIDSGTATYTFFDSSLTHCTGAVSFAVCESPTLNLSASVTTSSGEASTLPFDVGMYPTSGASQGAAVAASSGTSSFVWGAPFFFGTRVAVVRTTARAPGLPQTGALYAWEPTSVQ